MLKTGDRVLIQCKDRSVEGRILIASPNVESLMLEFEAIVDGHVGMMPVYLYDDGVYRAIFTETKVTITPIAD